MVMNGRHGKLKALIIVSILIVSGLTISTFITQNQLDVKPEDVMASWYNSNWAYSKQIIIDHNKVNANLTNFPVFIYNVSSDYSRALSNGSDFVFVNFDNTTKYNHEIEYFNGTEGKLVAWINVTSLSNLTDTIVWLYYGNPNSSNQQNVAGTWSTEYKAVWHMQYSPTGNVLDSTVNANTLTSVGTMTTSDLVNGTYGKAMDFDGTDDYLTRASTTSLSPTSVTLIATVYHRGYTPSKWSIGKMCNDQWSNYDAVTYGYGFRADTKFWGYYEISSNTGTDPSKGNYSLNTWGFVATSHNGVAGGSCKIYVNGSVGINPTVAVQALRYSGSSNFYIGCEHTGTGSAINAWTNFIVDEVWVVSGVLSAEAIGTLYSSQSSPATFAIFQEQPSGPTNNPPNTPTSLGPTTRQMAPTVTIYAAATDVDDTTITMYFYDNLTGAEIGNKSGASGSNISINWSGLSRGRNYSFYARANDSEAWSINSTVCTFSTNSRIAVKSMLINNQSDPTKLINFTPYISWSTSDGDGDTQSKYQVIVGTSENTSNMWDSGNITSANNYVIYAGSALSRSTKYYVTVRVYDGYEWSEWNGSGIEGPFYLFFDNALANANYVSVPHNDGLELGGSDYCVSLWIKPSDDPGFSRCVFSRRENNDTLVDLFSLYRTGTKKIALDVRNNGVVVQYVISTTNTETGRWYHVAAVRNGTNIYMYINGINVSSQASVTGDVPDFDVVLKIAGSEGYHGWAFNGSIDDVRLWKRGLSASEIFNIYNNTDPSSSNLIGWWKFNEGTGVMAQDSSVYLYNGTLQGTTIWKET